MRHLWRRVLAGLTAVAPRTWYVLGGTVGLVLGVAFSAYLGPGALLPQYTPSYPASPGIVTVTVTVSPSVAPTTVVPDAGERSGAGRRSRPVRSTSGRAPTAPPVARSPTPIAPGSGSTTSPTTATTTTPTTTTETTTTTTEKENGEDD